MEEVRQGIGGLVTYFTIIGLIFYVMGYAIQKDFKPLITAGMCALIFFGAVAALT